VALCRFGGAVRCGDPRHGGSFVVVAFFMLASCSTAAGTCSCSWPCPASVACTAQHLLVCTCSGGSAPAAGLCRAHRHLWAVAGLPSLALAFGYPLGQTPSPISPTAARPTWIQAPEREGLDRRAEPSTTT